MDVVWCVARALWLCCVRHDSSAHTCFLSLSNNKYKIAHVGIRVCHIRLVGATMSYTSCTCFPGMSHRMQSVRTCFQTRELIKRHKNDIDTREMISSRNRTSQISESEKLYWLMRPSNEMSLRIKTGEENKQQQQVRELIGETGSCHPNHIILGRALHAYHSLHSLHKFRHPLQHQALPLSCSIWQLNVFILLLQPLACETLTRYHNTFGIDLILQVLKQISKHETNKSYRDYM